MARTSWLTLVVLVATTEGHAQAPLRLVAADYSREGPWGLIIDPPIRCVEIYGAMLSLRLPPDPLPPHASRPRSSCRPIDITPKTMEGLERAVVSARFFELEDEYGGKYKSTGVTRELIIRWGSQYKHISISYLDRGEYLNMTKEERASVARFVDVWAAVRSVFDYPHLHDSRTADAQMIGR